MSGNDNMEYSSDEEEGGGGGGGGLLYSRKMEKIAREIEEQKKDPNLRGMFVSGWDDPDNDVGLETDPAPRETPRKEILWAAERGMLDIVLRLLAEDRHLVSSTDHDEYTPLHRACYNDHLPVVDALLRYGANLRAKTKMGWEPIHSACQWNHPTCVDRLLKAGANVNALSNGDQTPLHVTTSTSHCKSLLEILLLHPDVNARAVSQSGDMPEHLARRHGIYQYLFEIADPDISHIKDPAFTENPYLNS